ncbi:Conserved_hypothetical protein [Hexamita inflata]|uniref:Uncharacterized protein n=2 Tax=Hexamita inflata TaxID=28002 RepID=A0AA86PW74_9EUKA|nr:Conserved hypothetical protein [Hexamita inflata]
MTQQKLVFVNQYDSWQADLLDIRESKYMKEKVDTQFVSIFYNPACHMLHLKLLPNKTPAQTLEHIKILQKYLVELDLEPDIVTLTSDFGGEYKGIFDEYLVEHDIAHRVVLFDDLQLAPINSICRYLRFRIQRAIQELIVNENQHHQGQIHITQSQLETILDNLIKYHNFEKVIGLYDKTPVNITREQVDDVNLVKQAQNDELNNVYDFYIGDLVKVLLLKNKLEKKREGKWSKGTYKIINKIGSFYQLIPEPFDFKQYAQTFKLQRGYPWGIPAYHRKCYQLKFAKEPSKEYYSYELENTNHYTFDSIQAAVNQKDNVVSVYDALDENLSNDVFYRIKASTANTFLKEDSKMTYKIRPNQLKLHDKSIITHIEDNYLFGLDMPPGYVPVFLMK